MESPEKSDRGKPAQWPRPVPSHNWIERLRRELRICSAALRRGKQALARQRKAKALNGHRDWVRDRRTRTRRLIEYGGLVIKAGLDVRLEDDRATLLGALLALCDLLDGVGDDSPADLKLRWRRRGLRAFDADATAKAEAKQAGTRKEAEERIVSG